MQWIFEMAGLAVRRTFKNIIELVSLEKRKCKNVLAGQVLLHFRPKTEGDSIGSRYKYKQYI